MTMKKIAAAGLALAAMTGSAQAATNFTDNTVSCASTGDTSCSSATNTVGAGNEFTIRVNQFNPLFNVDFSNGLLTITAVDGPKTQFSVTNLTFANLTKSWATASLISSNVNNLTASDISLLPSGALNLNLVGSGPYTAGSQLQIALTAVPEPATWGLMIVGFGMVGGALRRRTNATPAFARA